MKKKNKRNVKPRFEYRIVAERKGRQWKFGVREVEFVGKEVNSIFLPWIYNDSLDELESIYEDMKSAFEKPVLYPRKNGTYFERRKK